MIGRTSSASGSARIGRTTAWSSTKAIGTPLDQRNVIRRFRAALKRVGLPETVRFHALWQAATLLVVTGVDYKTPSARLSQSNANITPQIYAYAVQALNLDAAERMQRVIRGIAGT